ncbi:MAG: SCO1664 family protein [Acidimicrobiales bacterium]
MTEQPDALLTEGDIEVVGRMPWSSNATMLVTVTDGEHEARAVYKPGRGERPLHDFPSGIFVREIAAYELSRWLGWDLVPATVLRRDAPLGPGSLQRFVEADFEAHYFTLYEDEDHHDQLRRMCLFDLLCNNTDRKGGHCLLDASGHIWAIDNGLSFHHQFKLRTVIWDFAGEAIPGDLLTDVARLHEDGPPPALLPLLDALELDALMARARAILAEPCFPVDTSGYRYPWPPI